MDTILYIVHGYTPYDIAVTVPCSTRDEAQEIVTDMLWRRCHGVWTEVRETHICPTCGQEARGPL